MIITIVGETMRRRFRGCGCGPLLNTEVLSPAILLALSRKPGYGYGLFGELKALGVEVPGCHPSVLYRMLRMLEMEGLLASFWDTEGSGPARRVYVLTEQGRSFLREWSRKAREKVAVIEKLIEEIEKGGV